MRIKLFYKLFLFASLITSIFCSMPADAASFSMTASSAQVTPGASFTISVGGDCIGRVNLSASGGSISQSAVWVEENRQTVSVTAGNSGTVTITATPEAGFSDSDGNEYKPGSRSVSVKVVAPSQPTQSQPSTPTPSGTTTKPQSTTPKPQTSPAPDTPPTTTPEPAVPAPEENPEDKEPPTEGNNEETAEEDTTAPTNPCQSIENSNKLAWTLVGVFALLFCGVTVTLVCVVFTSKTSSPSSPNQDKKVKHEKNSQT